MLSDVAHIEELLVVQDEKTLCSVEIGGSEDWDEGPHHELLDHEHSHNASGIGHSEGVSCSSHIHIVVVLSSCNESPVLLNCGFVLRGFLVKNVLSEESLAEFDGGLMVWRDAAIHSVKLIEVIIG